ncbi:disease resistance protein RPS5-like [Magnolia sinica]|uniref:disease resistance protein RPS5-like n=1 Tax=Magnolia sinica TaxID=86752 RepID=UPI002658149F|nr:disease resistance protein RPS5-like [Magnolia sinica]
MPFSVGTSSMTFQEEIRGTGKWWDTLEWDDPATKPLLHPLFKEVKGYNCNDNDDNDSNDSDEEEEEDNDDDDDRHEKEASEKKKQLLQRLEKADKNLDWIMNAKIGIVSAYGMGEVGKTTIMMNINNLLKDAKIFQSIIWVTVSEDLNLTRLQTDIVKKVELHFKEDDNEVSKAVALHEALMNRQKFLLILDDTWKSFSLKQVGIPKPTEENGCKIALTSRSLDICSGMKIDKSIKVEELSKEEV